LQGKLKMWHEGGTAGQKNGNECLTKGKRKRGKLLRGTMGKPGEHQPHTLLGGDFKLNKRKEPPKIGGGTHAAREVVT